MEVPVVGAVDSGGARDGLVVSSGAALVELAGGLDDKLEPHTGISGGTLPLLGLDLGVSDRRDTVQTGG